MQIPKKFAAPALVGSALAAILVSKATPSIAFGPFFLLICAFGAWFVGNRFAILLALFVATIQFLSGNALILDHKPVVLALQVCSALAVILMLGVARAALELEWRFARIDPLTGAFNRKAFFEAVENNGNLMGITVLVFADIDGLKRLNDRHGHEKGDETLRDFAERVRKAIRKDDIFARLGGDEFVVLLSVRDTAAAQVVARRLHRALNQDLTGRERGLGCSLGALVLPAGSTSIDAELKQADSLMYRAKREQIGLMMGISVKGKVQALMPVPSSSGSRESSTTVRWTARPIGYTETGGSPGFPLAIQQRHKVHC